MRLSAGQERRIRALLDAERRAVADVHAMPPQDLLRWVLDVATEDLAGLDPEARADRGYRLRSVAPRIPGLAAAGPSSPVGPMPDEQLAALQAEIRRGIESLMGPQHAWRIPVKGQVSLNVFAHGSAGAPKGEGRAARSTAYHWGCQTDDATTITALGVMSLLAQHGDRLRACERCGRPFIAVKRQKYCASSDCGQKTRDARKKKRRGAGS